MNSYLSKDKFDNFESLDLGFSIKTIANGWIVTPWGEPDSVAAYDTYVFNTREQLLWFLSEHLFQLDKPKELSCD